MDSAAEFTFFSPIRYAAVIVTKGWMGNQQMVDTQVTLEGDYVGACTVAPFARIGSGGDMKDILATQIVFWFGAVRGRTGLVVDDLLLYVTGGVAYAKFYNLTYFAP